MNAEEILPSGYEPRNEVLGICGSPRRGGNSDFLLSSILQGVKEQGIDTAKINITKLNLSGCIGCERCRKDGICTGLSDDMTPLYKKIASSRGLILVSPTHNYNMTAWMKAFIDRLYCFYIFENPRPGAWSSRLAGQRRKGIVASVCEQESIEDLGYTLEGMSKPLQALGYEILEEFPVFNTFSKGQIKNDQSALSRGIKMGNTLALSLIH